jgi:hypothetical protein
MFKTCQPEIREKRNMDGSLLLRLTRSIEELNYAEEFAVSTRDGSVVIQIERANWADWDHRGRLVFAQDGKIFEGALSDTTHLSVRELVDLSPARPSAVRSPDWASRW